MQLLIQVWLPEQRASYESSTSNLVEVGCLDDLDVRKYKTGPPILAEAYRLGLYALL
jgi:hypothetical protein